MLEEDEKECRVTNGLLTERGKDRECLKRWRVRVCERESMNMFADMGLIYSPRNELHLRIPSSPLNIIRQPSFQDDHN